MNNQLSPEKRQLLAAFDAKRKHEAELGIVPVWERPKRKGGWPRGKPRSAETRAKISAYRRGKKSSPETRAKMSAALKGRPGRPVAPETRAKISAYRRGKKRSPETRAKMSAAHRSPRRVLKRLKARLERTLALAGELRSRIWVEEQKLRIESAVTHEEAGVPCRAQD